MVSTVRIAMVCAMVIGLSSISTAQPGGGGSPYCGHLAYPGPKCSTAIAAANPNPPAAITCFESSRCDPTTHACTARPGLESQEVIYDSDQNTDYGNFVADPVGTAGRKPYLPQVVVCLIVYSCQAQCQLKYTSQNVPYWSCVASGTSTSRVAETKWVLQGELCADDMPPE